MASSALITWYVLPPKGMVLPYDFGEATGINVSPPNPLSSSTLRITSPTRPVAPTKAIFIFVYNLYNIFNNAAFTMLQKYYFLKNENENELFL